MVGSAFFCLHLPLSNSKPAVHVVHDVKLEHDVHPLGQSKQRPPPREPNRPTGQVVTHELPNKNGVVELAWHAVHDEALAALLHAAHDDEHAEQRSRSAEP